MRKFHLVLQWFLVLMLGLNLQACGSIQQMVQGTPTFTPTSSPTVTATSTPIPTQTPTPTITPDVAATQQYEAFSSLVQTYYDAGQISTTAGQYMRLDDFSDELATDFGYRWTKTNVVAKDFIIRSDLEWSTAIRANYAGCGYIFRQLSDQYYYMIALDAASGVLLSYIKDGTDAKGGLAPLNYSIGAIERVELPKMGSDLHQATFTLIVNGDSAYTYINNVFYSKYELKTNWLTESGPLSYLILSGSSIGYGTRCKITNSEAWIISY